MPADKFETEVVTPVPVEVAPLGFCVKVHVPLEGKPFKITLPVEMLQVGCVVVPTEGAVGALGAALMTTFAEAEEVHPTAFITEKV